MKYRVKETDTTFEDEFDALMEASSTNYEEDSDGKFTCGICGREFQDDGDMFSHIGWGHKLVEEVPETEKERKTIKRIKEIQADDSLSEGEKFSKICEAIMGTPSINIVGRGAK